MPLTDLIQEELLATLDGDGDPQAVLDRHAGSKGPLYAALARATAEATARFGGIRERLRDAQTRLRTAEARVTDADKRAAQAERRAAAAEKRVSVADDALAKRQALLNRAEALRVAGFGPEALDRLKKALDAAGPGDAVAEFLDAAADWSRLHALQAQVADAQQQAVEAERQATERVAAAHFTERAVQAARYLLRRKVTTQAVESWQAVATKLGLTDQELARGLAQALEQHGSLEAARRTSAATVDKLRTEGINLTGEVADLRRQREGLANAIAAVRDAGIAEVREVAVTAAAEVQRAAGEFERISTQAAELGQHVQLAQALATRDPAVWAQVQPETWAGLILSVMRWAEARMVAAVDVAAPDAIRARLENQVRYPYTQGAVRLTLPQLAAWLAQGIEGVPVRAVEGLVG